MNVLALAGIKMMHSVSVVKSQRIGRKGEREGTKKRKTYH